jgi:hypothetical protein
VVGLVNVVVDGVVVDAAVEESDDVEDVVDVVEVRSEVEAIVEDSVELVVSDAMVEVVAIIVDISLLSEDGVLVEATDDVAEVDNEESVEVDEDEITVESFEVVIKDVEVMVEYVVDPVESDVEESVNVELLISRAPVAFAVELFVIRTASATRSTIPTANRRPLDIGNQLQLAHTFAWFSRV